MEKISIEIERINLGGLMEWFDLGRKVALYKNKVLYSFNDK